MDRGSPVTRTLPSAGMVPRATRVQSAPCAYTTTASSDDAHRCASPDSIRSAPVVPVPTEAYAQARPTSPDRLTSADGGRYRGGMT